MTSTTLGIEELRHRYLHRDGVVYYNNPPYRRRTDKAVGSLDRHGYLITRHNGMRLAVHRLVWALHHGRLPVGDIDHINGIKSDNRPVNLREVTHSTNQQNQRKSHVGATSRYLGVHRNKYSQRSPWTASITVNGRARYIGCYRTEEEAHSAYLNYKRDLHAGCTI